MFKLFLDDIRFPPDGSEWIHARTVEEAKNYLMQRNIVEASFDHDLGENEPTGSDLVNWLVKEYYENNNNYWPTKGITIHSLNPVGSKYMKEMIDRYGPYKQGE